MIPSGLKWTASFALLLASCAPADSPEFNRAIDRFETMVLKYPDEAHDAEALMIDPGTGDLFLATKQKRVARVYAAAREQLADGATVTLTLAGEISFGDVSAGDISPDGSELILRRENAARLWRRAPGESVEEALKRAGMPASIVGPPREHNGESIAFHPECLGYYTVSEGQHPAIYFFPRRVEWSNSEQRNSEPQTRPTKQGER